VIVTHESYDSVLVGMGKQKGLESFPENRNATQMCALLQKKYEVVACEEESLLVVTVQSSATATGLVSCIVNVTSALMRTHPFHYFNGLSFFFQAPAVAGRNVNGRGLTLQTWTLTD